MKKIALKGILVAAAVCIALLAGCKVELEGGNIVVSNYTTEVFTGTVKAGSDKLFEGKIHPNEYKIIYRGSNGTISIDFKSDTSSKEITGSEYLESASVVYFRLK